MTAAPAYRAAASSLVVALEHAWTTIRSQHSDVPQVVIVVASGSDSRSRRLNLGHFAAGRWQVTSPEVPTDRPEVLVIGEGLHRGPVDVLGTLLHEAGRHSNPDLLVQLPRRGTALYGNDRRARVLPRPRHLQQQAHSCLRWSGVGCCRRFARIEGGVVALGS